MWFLGCLRNNQDVGQGVDAQAAEPRTATATRATAAASAPCANIAAEPEHWQVAMSAT